MRCLLFSLLILFNTTSHATTYYVSSTGSNENNGLTVKTPWQTLSKVQAEGNSGLIKAGDSIVFKRGDTFTGILKWATIWGQHCPTGTASKPITFTNYGNGPNPVFHHPPGDSVKAENRVLMLFSGVDYIVVDGLDFTDSDTQNDKINPGSCGVPIYLGTIGEATTNFCTIKNVNITLCGMGVVIVGDHNKVLHSKLTNFKNLKSTPDNGGSSAYDDYGANAITITGNDNDISYNYISGAWAESLDFGWNGGACEMYNSCSRNKLTHNTIYDCGGVAEFGAQEAGAFSSDNLFASNKIINCGTLSWCNITGEFAIQVSNTRYFNNTIIEDAGSRFSGPRTGEGIVYPKARALIKPDEELFGYNGEPEADIVFNLKNNIFILNTGIAISKKDRDQAKYAHENNIYRLLSGSVVNYKLNKSELITTEQVFKNDSSPDPLLWDYNLTKNAKGKIAGAGSQTLTVYMQAAMTNVFIKAIMEFCLGKSVSFNFSCSNILNEEKLIRYIAGIFFTQRNADAWFDLPA